MSSILRSACRAVLVLLALSASAFAQGRSPGTGNPDEHLVPWKFIEKEVPPPKGPFTLYWLPASTEETKHSRLLTSRPLGEAADRCVSFEIVVPGSAAVVEKLGATGKVPAALLADREDHIIRRVENVHGLLRAEDVERMMTRELSARDETMYAQMKEANQQAGAGNKTAAIELYKKVWDDRCLFPLAGTEAQRTLKNLGVVVQEPPSVLPPDPNLQPHPSKPPTYN